MRGKRYELEKLKGTTLNQYTSAIHQNDGQHTAQKLAAEYNVGKATIERDADFSRGIDAIAAVELN